MKQHNTHNDEELYQQIMAELTPGADEYDRIMSEGKNPASKRKVVMHIYKYVAAASILFAIIGTSLYMMIGDEDQTLKPVAEVVKPVDAETEKACIYDNTISKVEAETEAPDVADNVIAKSGISASNPVKTAQDASKNISADVEADEREQEFLYALITEVEGRALEEQAEEERLYRSIVEEVTANMSNESNKPELVL